MKLLTFLLILTLGVVFSVNAQPLVYSGYPSVTNDTIETNYIYPLTESGDTIIFSRWSACQVTMTADSVSGPAQGVMTLQYSETAAGNNWNDIATLTADGPTRTKTITLTNPMIYRRMRGKCASTVDGSVLYTLNYGCMTLPE